MTEIVRDPAASVVTLLTDYSFDSGELTTDQLVDQWLQVYSVKWVRLALVEALYQGRYKGVSVAQILAFWQRRGQPLHRFDPEFEQLVCDRLPKKLSTERQEKSGALTSAIEEQARSQAKVGQISSNTMIAPDSVQENKTVLNSLPNQAGVDSSSLSPPKIASESLPITTDSIPGRGDGQQTQASLGKALPSDDLKMSELGKVFSSSVRAEIYQSRLTTAANAAQTVWSELGGQPIHRFIPDTEASSLRIKLSEIALAERNGSFY